MAKKLNLRIAISQINPTLGAFSDNADKIISEVKRAQENDCDLVVFPESTIFGYNPFDLLEHRSLVDLQLSQISKIRKFIPKGMAVIIGVLTKNPSKKGKPFYNSAVVLQKDKKTQYFHKELLPTGDVFDEARFIESGDLSKNFFRFKNNQILVSICEDIWAWPDNSGKSQYKFNPITKIKNQKIDLVVNLSASPFYPKKFLQRLSLVKKTALFFKAPMIYTNLIGAQDEIVFDGQSFAVNSKGKILMRASSFQEDFKVLDFNEKDFAVPKAAENQEEEIRKALVLGIRDFCRKTGLSKVHLGLSGGVDSALVACLAVDALGPQNVSLIALPSQFNSPKSLSLAKELADNLSASFLEFPISEIFNHFRMHFDQVLSVQDFQVLHENMQARIRGTILMSIANLNNSLLLATSNKSEFAAGYSTLYGDMCGGLAPIGDLTKDQVYKLCEIYNSERVLIPSEIISRAPSAELRPNQKDQDSLPPYPDLDESVRRLVERCQPVKSDSDKWLLPKLLNSEFKRWQAPPILKVSYHSFGRGRRYPLAHRSFK